MSDQIRVDLVDNTAPGINSIEKNLDSLDETGEKAEATLNDVVASIEQLSENLVRETRHVEEHTASWTHFGAEAIPALASITQNVLKYSTELAALLVAQQKYEKIIAAVQQNQTALNIAKQQGFSITTKAVGALAGYAEAASGLVITVGALKAAHLALNTVLANTGQSADGLTNNLTRTREANSQLWDDIKATASAGAEAVGDWGAETVANAMRSIDELVGVSDAWKDIDRSVTESTNNYVNNTRVIGEAIRGVSREAVAASKAVAKAQSDAVDDFERVRMSNDEVAQSAKNRAEAERLASLESVDAINAELDAMKQRRGEAAAANKFSEDDQQRYVALVGQLEQRRTEIAKRNADEREKILKQESDQRAKSDQEYLDRYDRSVQESNEKILAEYRQQARDEIAERKAREREVDQFIQREMQKILDEERKKFEAMQQAARDRLELLKQERQARIDFIQNAANDDGTNMIDATRQQIDPRAVREQLAKQAEAQARANWVSPDDNAAKAGARRDAAGRAARMQAFRDFNAGKTSQADIAGAQNALIQNAAQQAQGRGQVDQQTVDALTQTLQNQQQMIQTQQQQQQLLQRLNAALSQVGGAARQTNAQARRNLF